MTTVDKKSIQIKIADMPDFMQTDAIDITAKAFEECTTDRDIAMTIKKEFDKKYTPTWHCIVGKSFGSFVTHETKNYLYYIVGQHSILLFKSG